MAIDTRSTAIGAIHMAIDTCSTAMGAFEARLTVPPTIGSGTSACERCESGG